MSRTSGNRILPVLILALGLATAHSQNIIAIVGTGGFDGQYFDADMNTTSPQKDNFGYLNNASWPATASCGGKLYISGGQDANHQTMKSIIVWDKTSNRTESHVAFDMTNDRQFHSMTCDPDGTHLIICGGQSLKTSSTSYNDCEKCSITGTGCIHWSTFGAHRYGHTSLVYNDQLLLMGGFDNDGVFMDTVFAISLSTANWYQLPSMPVSRAYFGAAVTAHGTVLACGGKDNDGFYNTCFQFDGSSWTTSHSLNLTRAYFAMVNYKNTLYALGDYEIGTVEVYNGQDWLAGKGKLLNAGYTYTAQIV